ncbi:transposase [Streptomyces sp. NPDC048564]|uniref:transposase n=1 Tax=unclassified Streptomyces TaxID=2593676 RepID=UPI003404A8E5
MTDETPHRRTDSARPGLLLCPPAPRRAALRPHPGRHLVRFDLRRTSFHENDAARLVRERDLAHGRTQGARRRLVRHGTPNLLTNGHASRRQLPHTARAGTRPGDLGQQRQHPGVRHPPCRLHYAPSPARTETSQRLGHHRWVIERTMSWLAGCRRLHRRYERKPGHFHAFTAIATSSTTDESPGETTY